MTDIHHQAQVADEHEADRFHSILVLLALTLVSPVGAVVLAYLYLSLSIHGLHG